MTIIRIAIVSFLFAVSFGLVSCEKSEPAAAPAEAPAAAETPAAPAAPAEAPKQ